MGLEVFEVLMGLSLLWITWLLSTIWESYNEDAYRRTMRYKGTGDKDAERTTSA